MGLLEKYKNYLLTERIQSSSGIQIQHPVDINDFLNFGFKLNDFREPNLIKFGYLCTNINPAIYFYQGRFYHPGNRFPIDPEDIQNQYDHILQIFRDKITSTYMKILYGFNEPMTSMTSLIFSGKISKLPDELYVHGDLVLKNCKNLKQLPSKLQVLGTLDIRGTNIQQLPPDLQAGEILKDK